MVRVYKTEWDSSKGQVFHSYLHNKVSDNIGRIGSAFLMNSGSQEANEQVQDVARTMAIHSAAMKPGYLNIENVDEKTIADTLEDAEVAAQKNLKEGMPENVATKVIEGVKKKALSQMYKRDVLME